MGRPSSLPACASSPRLLTVGVWPPLTKVVPRTKTKQSAAAVSKNTGGELPPPSADLFPHIPGGEEPCDDLDACSVDHNHCVRKKAAWIGDMHFGFGFKWAIVEHLYHYRGSQAHGSHYDQVHSGAMMIVTEDVSSRSNCDVSVIAWYDVSFAPALFIFQIINIPIAFLLA
ncbi:hypothetical protein ZWY2020_020883 [Hordeum vulgare]|nr:hypothetical protein ZWY2020_020883 [Hordeum vulgare]